MDPFPREQILKIIGLLKDGFQATDVVPLLTASFAVMTWLLTGFANPSTVVGTEEMNLLDRLRNHLHAMNTRFFTRIPFVGRIAKRQIDELLSLLDRFLELRGA